ncbi:MAG: N-methyl-L-tryptophan oxidase [Robiginitalea sp.]|uniref:N-methyl-L-tryptophan oxidase n=1 Tax=Robiginitalea sp. TaxID=1902411 RepID=UPI003C78C4EA
MERRELGNSTSGNASGGQTVAELYAQVHESMENVSAGLSYDVIVIGVGSMGASACYHLAKRGCRVLGLEQHDIPHELGSHAGQSRIIRKAYGEAIGYVPLLERAYENWRTLESETGSRVYYETGLTYFGPPGSSFLQTVRESAEKHQIPLEHLSPEACRRKYPQFDIPDHFECLEEPEAGLLTPERSILLLVQEALKHGADIHCGEPVVEWGYQDGGVTVRTPRKTYRAGKLVITAGAWAPDLLPALTPRLQVTRQALAWVQPADWERFTLGTFPCWHLEHKGYHFYGFPIMPDGTFGGPHGLKLALHHPGEVVTHPDTADRGSRKAEEQVLIEFLEKFLPKGYVRTLEMKTCLYTNTPDGHFVVDYLKGYGKDVVVAAGFSGHGFKFASVIGEVLADLALEGATPFPIDFLSADRFDS